MKKVEKYVDAEVMAFKDDIVNIDGIQFLPVSDVKAHIGFAVRKAQIDAIDKTISGCVEDVELNYGEDEGQSIINVGKKLKENFDVKLAKSYIDKLTDEDKIRFLEILLDEIKPVFEIRGMAEDGGKYSEFELKSIKLTNRKKVSDGLNCLSAKVYQEDFCFIKY